MSWLGNNNANRYKQTYMQGFLDISGGNLLLRNGNLLVSGDSSMNGNVTLNKSSFVANTYAVADFSANIGTNWTDTNQSSGSFSWQSVSISATGQYQVATLRTNTENTGNIWISNNYGKVWSDTTIQNSTLTTGVGRGKWQDISISKNGQYITAISKGLNITEGNIYISNNYGTSWTPNTGFNISQTGYLQSVSISRNGQYQTIVSSPSDSTNVGSIYVSSNYGINLLSWTKKIDVLYGFQSVSISATGQYQTAIQRGISTKQKGNIYYSNTYGTTWMDTSIQIYTYINATVAGEPVSDFENIISMSANGKYQTILGLGTTIDGVGAGAIYTNSSYGEGAWSSASSSLLSGERYLCVNVSAPGQYQVVSTFNSEAHGRILISKNYGSSWSELTTPMPTNSNYYRAWQSLSMSDTGEYITAVIRYHDNSQIQTYGNIYVSSVATSSNGSAYIKNLGSANQGNVSANHAFQISVPENNNSSLLMGYDLAIDGVYMNATSMDASFQTASKNMVLQTQGGLVGIGTQYPTTVLDISGNTNVSGVLTSSDVSANRVFCNSIQFSGPAVFVDVSTNQTNILGNKSFIGNVGVGKVASGYNLDVSGTIGISGGIVLNSGDASFNGSLKVKNSIDCATLTVGGVSLSGSYVDLSTSQTIAGVKTFSADASFNSKLFLAQDASFNSKLFLAKDASLNGNLFLAQDASFNGKLFLVKDASFNGNLKVQNDINCATLTVGGKTILTALATYVDLSNPQTIAGVKTFSSDASFSANINGRNLLLNPTGNVSQITFSSGTATNYGEMSFYKDISGTSYKNRYFASSSNPNPTVVVGQGGATDMSNVLIRSSGTIIIDASSNAMSNTGNTVIQPFGGNVGIGKMNPTTSLDISGTLNVSRVNDSSNATLVLNGGKANGLGPILQLYGSGGLGASVGINLDTTTTNRNFTKPACQILATESLYNTSDLIFKTAPIVDTAGTTTSNIERMRITNSGSIGIGTSTPGTYKIHPYDTALYTNTNCKLDISGGMRIYESVGSGKVNPDINGTLIIQHGDASGCSSILFPGTLVAGGDGVNDYGSITYYDNVAQTNPLNPLNYYGQTNSESSALVINVQNNGTGSNGPDNLILKASGHVVIDSAENAYITSGLSIGKTITEGCILDVSGNVKIRSTTDISLNNPSIGIGALVVSGGVRIDKNVSVGNGVYATNVEGNNITANNILESMGTLTVVEKTSLNGDVDIDGITQIKNETDCSFNSSTVFTGAALDISGGLGVRKQLYVKGVSRFDGIVNTKALLNISGGFVNSSTSNFIGKTFFTGDISMNGINVITNPAQSGNSTSGALVVAGGVGIGGAINTSGAVNITSTTDSTSKGIGALIVSGGVGIGGNVFANGYNIVSSATIGNSTINIQGTTTTNSYLNINAFQSTTQRPVCISPIGGGVSIGKVFDATASLVSLDVSGNVQLNGRVLCTLGTWAVGTNTTSFTNSPNSPFIVNGISSGTGNGATTSLYNLSINSAQGIGFVNGSTGACKMFMDVNAGSITCGGDSYFNGVRVGRGNNSISTNTVVGSGALNSNTTGSYTIGIGLETLNLNTTGSYTTAIGCYALQKNTLGNNNTAVGCNTLQQNISGNINIAVGDIALNINTTGSNNTAIGGSTLKTNTTGNNNTALGYLSGATNTTASFNTFLGGNTDLNGGGQYTNSTAIGYNAKIDATNQIVLGTSAEKVVIRGIGLSNSSTSGALVVAGGVGVGENLRVAGDICGNRINATTALYEAGTLLSAKYAQLGVSNTFLADSYFNGVRVGKGPGTSTYNTVVGYNSLNARTSGDSNTALGYGSGAGLTTGSNNTFLGAGASVSVSNVTNSTAIGYNAIADASFQIVLGTSTEIVKIPGGLFVYKPTRLGNTNDSSLNNLISVSYNPLGANTCYLKTYAYRINNGGSNGSYTGNTWYGSVMRTQFNVDGSPMGMIEYNAVESGIGMYDSLRNGITVANGGNVSMNKILQLEGGELYLNNSSISMRIYNNYGRTLIFKNNTTLYPSSGEWLFGWQNDKLTSDATIMYLTYGGDLNVTSAVVAPRFWEGGKALNEKYAALATTNVFKGDIGIDSETSSGGVGSGAFRVNGGASIAKSVYIGGPGLTIGQGYTNTTPYIDFANLGSADVRIQVGGGSSASLLTGILYINASSTYFTGPAAHNVNANAFYANTFYENNQSLSQKYASLSSRNTFQAQYTYFTNNNLNGNNGEVWLYLNSTVSTTTTEMSIINSTQILYFRNNTVNRGAQTAFLWDLAGYVIMNLYANGQLSATSFNATSDYRIKENPQPLDSSFTVDALKPVHYTNTLLNREDMGFIAHEVQEVFPFLVTGEKDGETNQTLNYSGFIALLVKEVQELKENVKSLQSDNKSLQSDNLLLKSDISSILKRLELLEKK